MTAGASGSEASSSGPADRAAGPPSLRELAAVFLKLSLLGFGGPNAHLALMLDEVVERRRWLDREHFLQLVALTNLLPGPNSSEVAIHVGHTQRGWPGALATGLAFLVPTFVMVVALSWAYFTFGTLPAVETALRGLQPAVLAIIAWAGLRLGRTAVGDALTLALAAAGALVGWLVGGWAVAAMVAGGVVTWARWRARRDGGAARAASSAEDAVAEPREEGAEDRNGPTEDGGACGEEGTADGGRAAGRSGDGPQRRGAWLPLVPAALVGAGTLGTLGAVFWTHLWIGSVLFGGGYVLVALLQPYAVDGYGWLTDGAFLDGVALTQAVPGPISTLSAFVGYAAAGVPGAVLATAGVYLPAFAAVLLVAPHLARLRSAAPVKAALEGVSAVVAGAILGVAAGLAPSAVADLLAAAIFVAAFVALAAFRVASGWVVLGGLAVGVGLAVV